MQLYTLPLINLLSSKFSLCEVLNFEYSEEQDTYREYSVQAGSSYVAVRDAVITLPWLAKHDRCQYVHLVFIIGYGETFSSEQGMHALGCAYSEHSYA